MKTQQITIQTLTGARSLEAPAGFTYDKTARIAWAKLLTLAGEHAELKRDPRSLQRDIQGKAEAIGAVANILASSLGMSDFYWQQAAVNILFWDKQKGDTK